jgi:uncharacterized membrane protein
MIVPKVKKKMKRNKILIVINGTNLNFVPIIITITITIVTIIITITIIVTVIVIVTIIIVIGTIIESLKAFIIILTPKEKRGGEL